MLPPFNFAAITFRFRVPTSNLIFIWSVACVCLINFFFLMAIRLILIRMSWHEHSSTHKCLYILLCIMFNLKMHCRCTCKPIIRLHIVWSLLLQYSCVWVSARCAPRAVTSYVSTKLSGARCVNLYLLPCNLLVGFFLFFLSFFIPSIKCENEEEKYCMICKKSMSNNGNKIERQCSIRMRIHTHDRTKAPIFRSISFHFFHSPRIDRIREMPANSDWNNESLIAAQCEKGSRRKFSSIAFLCWTNIC